jgi:hypothetical protein
MVMAHSKINAAMTQLVCLLELLDTNKNEHI